MTATRMQPKIQAVFLRPRLWSKNVSQTLHNDNNKTVVSPE
jgi:hypothetical protein